MCESTTHTFQGGANKEHRPLIQASSSDSSGKNRLFSQTVEQTQGNNEECKNFYNNTHNRLEEERTQMSTSG